MRLNICVIAFLIISFLMTSCSQENEKTVFEQPDAIDARPFLSEKELLKSVSAEAWASLDLTDHNNSGAHISALVVPHHAAAAALTAEAVSRLAESQPPSVIILAPNHYNEGPAASSTTLDFICYESRLTSDEAAIGRLAAKGMIIRDDRLFTREHSVGVLLPILSWYLPETKIITVIFHHDCNEQKILSIIEALKPERDAGAVIIASIDFSHYLTRDEAIEKDLEMREYLENGDAETIARLDASYIDAPAIMTALLRFFGTEGMEIIANTNSGILMQNSVAPCTSYFTIQFLKK